MVLSINIYFVYRVMRVMGEPDIFTASRSAADDTSG